MTDISAAKTFADAHLDKAFNAVLMDAVLLPAGVLAGRIFLDTTGRFCDGDEVVTSRVISSEAGRVYATKNTRYLVSMSGADDAPVPVPLPVRTEYVAGFMFTEDRTHVALILKRKPDWMRGKYNAIGGKIEPGETALEAMVREFAEETGVETEASQWGHVSTLIGGEFIVHFYAAFSDDVWEVRTMEDEEIFVGYVSGFLTNPALMRNLPVMMTLALDTSGIVKPVELADALAVAA